MAQSTTVTFVDDIDGESEATYPDTEFALDGVTYAIDLSSPNYDRLCDSLSEFVDKARRVGGRQRRRVNAAVSGRTSAKMDGEQKKAMRDWARLNGWPNLGDRGRIPNDAVEAYHNQDTAPAKTRRTTKKISA